MPDSLDPGTLSSAARNPYREPSDREREQARIIVGRITTAFGNKIDGGDAQAREHAEWVVNGFPWVRKDEPDELTERRERRG